MKKILVALIAAGLASTPFVASAKIGKIKKTKFAKKGGLTIGAYAIGGPTAGAMGGGGLLSFNNINNPDLDDKQKQSSFSIAPTVGYFVMDNLEIELGLGYGSAGTEDNSTSMWALTPTLRYYLPVKALQKKGMNLSLAFGYTYGSIGYEDSCGGGVQGGPAPAAGDMTAAPAAGDMTAAPAAGDPAAAAAAAAAAMGTMEQPLVAGGGCGSDTLSGLNIGAGVTQVLGAAQGAFIRLGLDYNLMKLAVERSDDDTDYSGLSVGVQFGAFLY